MPDLFPSQVTPPVFELLIPISTDPITGYGRQAKVANFNWSLTDGYIKLSVLVVNVFSQKALTKTSRIKDYEVTLTCDNSSTVDPKTGQFILTDADGVALSVDPVTGKPLTGVGQYDFYISTAQTGPVDILGEITMLVQRADSLGRFDI